jgi:hypothetical protein
LKQLRKSGWFSRQSAQPRRQSPHCDGIAEGNLGQIGTLAVSAH